MNLELKINDEFKDYLARKDGRTNPFTKKLGIQYVFKFENGYGASVIKTSGSYGYEDDLWELGLLRDGYLEYTELTNFDVLGCLTDEQVNIVLTEIKNGNVNTYINLEGLES